MDEGVIPPPPIHSQELPTPLLILLLHSQLENVKSLSGIFVKINACRIIEQSSTPAVATQTH